MHVPVPSSLVPPAFRLTSFSPSDLVPSSVLAALRDPETTNVEIADVLPRLAGYRYMLLTTTKKDGTPVSTPVWFAPHGDALVATSEVDAWKVKRLRRDPNATVAPCDVRGTKLGKAVPVVGEILSERDGALADRALARRYGAAYEAMGLVSRVRRAGRPPRRAYMALRPVEPAAASQIVEPDPSA